MINKRKHNGGVKSVNNGFIYNSLTHLNTVLMKLMDDNSKKDVSFVHLESNGTCASNLVAPDKMV